MPALAKFLQALFLAALLAGCATPTTQSTAHKNERMVVRTTAYCPGETGGRRNAIGEFLSGRRSAAADWSRFPIGTRFKIVATGEEFVIDDYGNALVGTRTIDLFKTSRSEMKKWGVRHVEIEILQWGSYARSVKILTPRAHNSCARRMLIALAGKKDRLADGRF